MKTDYISGITLCYISGVLFYTLSNIPNLYMFCGSQGTIHTVDQVARLVPLAVLIIRTLL